MELMTVRVIAMSAKCLLWEFERKSWKLYRGFYGLIYYFIIVSSS